MAEDHRPVATDEVYVFATRGVPATTALPSGEENLGHRLGVFVGGEVRTAAVLQPVEITSAAGRAAQVLVRQVVQLGNVEPAQGGGFSFVDDARLSLQKSAEIGDNDPVFGLVALQ